MTQPSDPFSPEEPLTDDERAAFATLPRELTPDAGLEDRVLMAVTLHQSRRRLSQEASRWLQAAAAVVIFALGYVSAVAGARTSTPTPSVDGRYLLLLYDVPGTTTADPAAMPTLVAEYTDWFNREHAAGVVESGEQLDIAARTLGPATPAAPPSGFFVVRARSLDEAVAISEASPHRKHGGAIIVRPIAR